MQIVRITAARLHRLGPQKNTVKVMRIWKINGQADLNCDYLANGYR